MTLNFHVVIFQGKRKRVRIILALAMYFNPKHSTDSIIDEEYSILIESWHLMYLTHISVQSRHISLTV